MYTQCEIVKTTKNRLLIILLLLPTLALLNSGCGESVDNPATAMVTTAAATTQPYPTPPFIPPATALPPPKTDWPTSAPPPPGFQGWAKPRLLNEAQKAAALQVALQYPATAAWLQGRTDYFVFGSGWYGIIWEPDGTPGIWWALDEATYLAEGVPNYINPNVYWYTGVNLRVGDGQVKQMQIAVDIDAGKVVMADGPYIPPGTPQLSK